MPWQIAALQATVKSRPNPGEIRGEILGTPAKASQISYVIDEEFFQVDTSEQLRNVSKMKLYRYRYSREYMEHAGLDTSECEGEDTGVLAQEVKEVLPEAVKESVSEHFSF